MIRVSTVSRETFAGPLIQHARQSSADRLSDTCTVMSLTHARDTHEAEAPCRDVARHDNVAAHRDACGLISPKDGNLRVLGRGGTIYLPWQ